MSRVGCRWWVAAFAAMFVSAGLSWAGEPAERSPLGLAVLDTQGAIHRLGDSDGCRAVCLVFLSPECPISNQYTAELNRIAQSLPTAKIELYGVVVDEHLKRAAVKQHYDKQGVQFPILFDPGWLVAERCQPTKAAEAFVYLPDSKLAYRGRIDDQYAPDGQRHSAVIEHTLSDAIAALVAGRAIAQQRTEPVGCPIEPLEADTITYARHIAPLLAANCAECHRPGEVAPFALLSYDDAAKRAAHLADVTHRKIMPPWHAREGWGDFRGQRRLSVRELAWLTAWSEAGAPQGDTADLPPAPQFASGWQLGEPDLILQMPEAYEVPASGPDAFRFFVIPVDIPEDRVVAGVEFRAGNPRIVHHAILYLDASGVARKRDAADPTPGYEGFLTGGFRPSGTLGFWAPGYTPRYLPEGVGQRLRKGVDLAMQLHYHPSGKAESDQSQVGVYFARRPVESYLSAFAMINFDVNISPGEKRHHMQHTFTTPIDLELLNITPHMHMIGTEMKVTATQPDGQVRRLAWSDWNFNWQEQYLYRQPLRLPKGTRIDLEAYYDNSADNPFNPSSPPKRVTFGEMTTDEMCICAFGVINRNPGDRKVLQQAIAKSMQPQLANPRVMLSLMQFIQRGTPPGESINLQELLKRGVEED